MILQYLKTLADFVTAHPVYLAAEGCALAVILFLIFQKIMGYFTDENRTLRSLRGHGIIYRFLRLEVLTLVACVLCADIYEYLTFPKWKFNYMTPDQMQAFLYWKSRLAPRGVLPFAKWESSRGLGWLTHWILQQPAPVEHAFELSADWVVLHSIPAMLFVSAGTFAALELLDRRIAKRYPAAAAHPPQVMIGGVPYFRERWTGHLLIPGTTRAGKSTLLKSMLCTMTAQGVPGLILDNGGDFTSKFYNPTSDTILSPLDGRDAGFSFFGHLTSPLQIQRLGHSLVARGATKGEIYFNDRSRELFVAIGEELWARGSLTNGEFCKVMKDQELLKKLVRGTEWESVIKDARSWGDIYSTFTSFFAIFNSLAPPAGLKKIALSEDGETWKIEHKGVNILELVRAMGAGRPLRIIVPYRDEDTKPMGGFLSMVTSIFVSSVQSLPENHDRRIVVIADELGEMAQVADLQTALAKSGKYGLSMVLGIQNMNQLKEKYGDTSAKIILGLCSSVLILRLPDQESALWAADMIGKAYKKVQSTSTSSGEHSSHTKSEHEELRHRVLPSQIQHLPNLQGLLIYFGTGLVKRVNLLRHDFKEVHPRHVDLPAARWLEGRTARVQYLDSKDDEKQEKDNGASARSPISLS